MYETLSEKFEPQPLPSSPLYLWSDELTKMNGGSLVNINLVGTVGAFALAFILFFSIGCGE